MNKFADKKIETNLCQRCKNYIEDHDHIYSCHQSIIKLPTSIVAAKIIAKTRRKTSYYYKTISVGEPNMTMDELFQAAGITNNENFLRENPLSKGIITKESILDFKRNTPNLKDNNLWFQYLVDCWMSGFYNTTYTERTLQVEELRRRGVERERGV
jgi:hypothetical protein